MLELVPVALPVPLRRHFDYQVPEELADRLRAGMRVEVPFGRRRLVGLLLDSPRHRADAGLDYKPLGSLLDEAPVAPPDWLRLVRWAAEYYQHPVGEVVAAALPAPLREGRPARARHGRRLSLTAEGRAAREQLPARSIRLRRLLDRLAELPFVDAAPGEADGLEPASLRRALAEGWVLEQALPPPEIRAEEVAPELTAAQVRALSGLQAAPAGFSVSLLEGVTGSGKTELYLRLAAEALARGRQVLVLSPEIGLTPQLAGRFRARFGRVVASYHSGMTEIERNDAWLDVREGRARVLVGTRSAVFAPFAALGLVLVDEEHDASFKQQEGFRYHARDLALLRAREAAAPAVLGSATPSLESLSQARSGRYRHVPLPERISGSDPPPPQLIDLRVHRPEHGLSPPLLERIGVHLEAGGQALLFINRRGYAPTLLCEVCHWLAPCPRCDARMTVHRGRGGRLLCHHCGHEQVPPAECPSCGSRRLLPLGEGTERIEEALRNRFPGRRVERFDAERLRGGDRLERLLEEVRARRVDILVGTQMLAKGHDFPALSLVGVVNADQALYSADFRALERLGQLLTQVAGRAGRTAGGSRSAEVLIQTREPEHPQLLSLLREGYPRLAERLLRERAEAGLPPAGYLALLRAEATRMPQAQDFLHTARQLALALPAAPEVQLLGPAPAPMERRDGRYRAQLLLMASRRNALHRLLRAWLPALEGLPEARRLRWSLDVDPVDLF